MSNISMKKNSNTTADSNFRKQETKMHFTVTTFMKSQQHSFQRGKEGGHQNQIKSIKGAHCGF
jgi:hypothetical protein